MNMSKSYNALCQPRNLDLEAAVNAVKKDPDVRVRILTGGSKCFAAGADIHGMMEADPLGVEKNAALGKAMEEALFSKAFSTADQKEDMKAFAEKRPPRFGDTR